MVPENKTTISFSVQYRHDIETLVVRWRRECTTEEVKLAYEELLVVAIKHKVYRWLLDVRRRDDSNPALSLWLQSGFFARILPNIGGSVRIAYLVLPRKLVEVAERNDLLKMDGSLLSSFGDKTCNSKAFVHESEVYNWLNELN